MNGLTAVYGNLGAQLLGLANAAAAERTPGGGGAAGTQLKRGGSPSPSPLPFGAEGWARAPFQQQGGVGGSLLPSASTSSSRREENAGGDDDYEDEVIEEMSGGWAQPVGVATTSSSSTSSSSSSKANKKAGGGAGGDVPRIDSVEWSKMEEGPDDENPTTTNADPDDDESQRSLRKRKRKSLNAAADDDKGKKRLSCIDCGCRAALKACAKVMCIDCCAKEGRVCDAHAKKLYEKEVRKLEMALPGSSGADKESKEKENSSTGSGSTPKPGKKRARVRSGEGEGKQVEEDAEDAYALHDEDSDEATPERRDMTPNLDQQRNSDADEVAKAKRSGVLYETIMKQDKKIRALQNDLKELRTLLLSVVDKQSAFSRQLRHLSGGSGSDGLVIDEDEEADDEDRP